MAQFPGATRQRETHCSEEAPLTVRDSLSSVLFLLRVYVKKTTYDILNNILPVIHPEVPPMTFTWLLESLCRTYGAIPKQKAVKVNPSVCWYSQDPE